MSAWSHYKDVNIDENGRHRDHPRWKPVGVWEFEREDGLMTAHKAESPHSFWSDTVEWSMKLADKCIPLGAPLPEGMRSRSDPLYDEDTLKAYALEARS